MAVPPDSFTSLTPMSPPDSNAAPRQEGATAEPVVAAVPPEPAPPGPTGDAGAPSTPSEASPEGKRRQSVFVGSVLGLAAGLGVGFAHFDKQPQIYESAARLQVAGPGGIAASAEAEAAVVQSPRVLDRAARRLDEQKPFEVPPPVGQSEAAAFIDERLTVTPQVAESGMVLSFRAPSQFDAAKYLRAVIEAYRVEVEGRSKGTVPAAPGSPPHSPAGADSLAAIDARIAEVKRKLADLSEEPVADVRSRLEQNRAELPRFAKRDTELNRTIAVIEKAGASAVGRLEAMKELGLAADAGSLARVEAAEKEMKALQQKKADLGRRLGPEHRDMLALDDEIQQVKAEIAKANAEPTRPDELDQLRGKLEADRTALAIASAALRSAIVRDEKILEATAPLTAELTELQQSRAIAVRQPTPNEPVRAAAPLASSAGGTVEVVQPPSDGERIAPQLYRSLVPGGLLGLIGGGLLGLLIPAIGGAARERVRRVRETVAVPKPKLPALKRPVLASRGPGAVSQLHMPVLGRIPTIQTNLPSEKKSTEGLNPILVAFHRPGSAEAEAFRQARRELTAALDGKGHQVLVLTSPDRGDGKSTVAANLAISLAQSGKRVILVDCDLATPAVQGLFRLTRLGDGLKSIMASEVDLRMAVRGCEVGNLYLLPAGRGDVDPADILTRPKFRELIAELKSSYEYVVLDAPPVTAEQELAALAGNVGGMVLVVRSGPDAVVRSDRAKGRIVAAGSEVIGAIETSAPVPPRTDTAASTAPQESQAPAAAQFGRE